MQMKRFRIILFILILFNSVWTADNEEFRATWVVTWHHISAGATVEENQARVRKILDLHKQANMNSLRKIRIYRQGDMPNSIRVAIASNNEDRINAGFNDCEQFYIYQISSDEIRLIAIRAAATKKDLKSEQRQYYRADIIEDCQGLYTTVIGGRAAAKLVNKEVHPVRVLKNSEINQLLNQLQYVLSHTPPPWLAKSMGVDSTNARANIR